MGVPSAKPNTTLGTMRAKGVKQVELSWILEDNRPMRHIIESLGASAYKTYRVYEKTLTSHA